MSGTKFLVLVATVLLPILISLSVITGNVLWFVVSSTIVPLWTAVMIQLKWEDLD